MNTHSPITPNLFSFRQQWRTHGISEFASSGESRLAVLRRMKQQHRSAISKLERTEQELIDYAQRLGNQDLFEKED